MSKLFCPCGHWISDVRYPSPTEGEILCQQNDYSVFEAASREIAAFFAAVNEGNRNQWLKDYFDKENPGEVNDEVVVYDIVTNHFWPATKIISECENCGRLHVQKTVGENRYLSYAPDDPGYHKILQER